MRMVDLCEKCGHRAVCRFREHYEECLQFIEDVVRCKDCKWWHRKGLCPMPDFHGDAFCSYGERRDNA